MRSLHKVTIFTTLRYKLVAKVPQHERIVINKLGLEGIYGCVIQYGYADTLNLEGDNLVNQVTDSLGCYIQKSSGSLPSVSHSIEEELLELEHAKRAGIVHVRGKTRFHVGKDASWFDKVILGFYEVLHSNCRSALPALGIPLTQRIEVGMLYEA